MYGLCVGAWLGMDTVCGLYSCRCILLPVPVTPTSDFTKLLLYFSECMSSDFNPWTRSAPLHNVHVTFFLTVFSRPYCTRACGIMMSSVCLSVMLYFSECMSSALSALLHNVHIGLSGTVWPPIASHRLLLMLAGTPLQIFNHRCPGFPVSGGV